MGPQDCRADDADFVELHFNQFSKATQQKAKKFWPTLMTGSGKTTYNFHSHEWSKHGTCWQPRLATASKVAPNVRGINQAAVGDLNNGNNVKFQEDYFKVSLGLNDLLNQKLAPALVALEAGDDGLVDRDDLLAALTRPLGITKIKGFCKKNGDGESALTELYISLDLSYNPINSPKPGLNGCARRVKVAIA